MAGRIFHKRHGLPYRLENSMRGIMKAARAGGGKRYAWIDLDVNMTKDGVLVNTHWPLALMKDGFSDPLHRIPKTARISQLTLKEVSRLRAPGGYRINTLQAALKKCAAEGIGAKIEPKGGDTRYESVETWRPVKAYADSVGCRVSGYVIRTSGSPGHGARVAKAMSQAGIPSHTIR